MSAEPSLYCLGPCRRTFGSGEGQVKRIARNRCTTCYRLLNDPDRRTNQVGRNQPVDCRVSKEVEAAIQREAARRSCSVYALVSEQLTKAARRW